MLPHLCRAKKQGAGPKTGLQAVRVFVFTKKGTSMNGSENTFTKTVDIILAPGDSGPICSYSPYCSPSDSNCTAFEASSAPKQVTSRLISRWRHATITMVENPLHKVPPNEERKWVETWLLQLVRCELTHFLTEAESRAKQQLAISISDPMADLIAEALKLRGAVPKEHPQPVPEKKTARRSR